MTKTATQPKLDGLEQKFKLLALLPYDERAKRKHSLVFGFVLDWYHSKYGDALASVRHVVTTIKERDPAGKGMSLPHVHSALSDLVAWGYLEQTLGTGKRASRYVPNWSRLTSSVTTVGNANDNDPSVTHGVNTDVTPGVNTTAFAVTPVGNEDLSTPTRAQDPGTGIDRIECATPSAPLAAGLGATAARTAQGGFEKLWKAYGHRQRKADARAAFEKLDPSPELLEQMVTSAEAWRAAWSAQGNPAAPRFTLVKWLEREQYDCDPPTAYRPKEAKAKSEIPAPPPASKPPTNATRMVGAINPWTPFGTFTAEIVGSDVSDGDYPGDHVVRFQINWSGPSGDDWFEDTWHEFLVQSDNAPELTSGRDMFNSIAAAVGLDTVEDTEDMHHRPFLCTIHKDLSISYAPLPDNDNVSLEAVA